MIHVVTIGWWAGTFNVLYGLKRHTDYAISAIISVADSGGTAGLIRDKYGILPPWDFRRAIAALAKNTETVRKLFEYSFKNEEWVIWGNKIGNILFTALTDIYGGNEETAINTLSEMFDVRGQVIPVTLEHIHLAVRFEDNTVVVGEKYIDVSEKNDFARTHNIDQNILEAWLEWGEWVLNPRARDAIMDAHYIIIGPGDLYTSLIPNLLCQGMSEALRETQAKIIYICNAMTKRGETTNMEVIDFVDTIEKYLRHSHTSLDKSEDSPLDFVIVNNGDIPEDLEKRYRTEENKKPLKIRDRAVFENKRYTLIERNLVHTGGDYVRHDPEWLMQALNDIIRGTS